MEQLVSGAGHATKVEFALNDVSTSALSKMRRRLSVGYLSFTLIMFISPNAGISDSTQNGRLRSGCGMRTGGTWIRLIRDLYSRCLGKGSTGERLLVAIPKIDRYRQFEDHRKYTIVGLVDGLQIDRRCHFGLISGICSTTQDAARLSGGSKYDPKNIQLR